MYPAGKERILVSLGWAGGTGTPAVLASPAASLDDFFDHPARFRSPSSANRKNNGQVQPAHEDTGPLTISRVHKGDAPYRRVVDLVGAHRPGALRSSRRAPCEKAGGRGGPGVVRVKLKRFGLGHFASAFMNNSD